MRFASSSTWNPESADDELWDQLHGKFTEEEIVELGYWIGFTFGGQRFLKTLGSSQGQLQDAIDTAGGRESVQATSTTSD